MWHAVHASWYAALGSAVLVLHQQRSGSVAWIVGAGICQFAFSCLNAAILLKPLCESASFWHVTGSSAGSASAVAARFAPWSLCEDTGGSCRAPAMANGIYGIRPTLGCYNFSDALVLATFTRDTVGESPHLQRLRHTYPATLTLKHPTSRHQLRIDALPSAWHEWCALCTESD